MKTEEIRAVVREIGTFSPKLEQVLAFLLGEADKIKDECQRSVASLKSEVDSQFKDITDQSNEDKKFLLELIRQEKEDRQSELKELESLTKAENLERKKETQHINADLNAQNEKRVQEAQTMKAKMEKEKRELQAYLEQDTKDMILKMENESKALQQKLDKEAKELRDTMNKENEQRTKESQALAQKLEQEKDALAKQLESGTKELTEQLSKDGERRKRESEDLKTRLEDDKKQHGNEITQMFDRLKSENEGRKQEIHGLKDVLVRENEKRMRETDDLRVQVESGMQHLMTAVEKETSDCKARLQQTEDDLSDTIKKDKQEGRDKVENLATELRKKVEIEANALRDRMQLDKKTLLSNLEEGNDERRKEVQLLKNQIAKDREELRAQTECDAKVLLEQLEKDSNDILGLLKKERVEREKGLSLTKDRMENDKKELQISIDKDRDSFVRKLNEEHDQRRLEQMEMKERLDNNEKSNKGEVQELFVKMKREIDAREQENEELVQDMRKDRSQMEEKLLKERQNFRESLNSESMELGQRMDKLNVERINDSADIQAKVAMLGKSASRHIDNLKHYMFREFQGLFDLATKPCSVVFNAFRDESYVNGGEDYITFTGCTVNIGNGMNPKSGEFKCPEAGLYLFLFTCCTFDMKKCLISIRKNGKDVTNFHDQDGDQNKGKTMIGQNVLLELVAGDRVQIYAYTSTGMTDHKNSRYTQFLGILMRPSVDSMHEVVRRLGGVTDLDDDVSVVEDSLRSTATLRGAGMNGDSRRESRKGRSRTVSRISSPPPLDMSTASFVPPAGRALSPLALAGTLSLQVEENGPIPARSTDDALGGKSKKNGTKAPHKSSPEKEQQTQSYLALTSLGVGRKSVENGIKKAEAPQRGSVEREKTPNRLVSVQKKRTPAVSGKSTVAQLANSTLKGFSKM